jgi:glutamate/tyrosine decarboxylase-like PLP-dependent enzyme
MTIWLYRNIIPENLHKSWMKKLMMMGLEYKYALSASELLGEIEEFKRDEG